MFGNAHKPANNDLRLFFGLQWLAGIIPLISLLEVLTLDKTGAVGEQYQLLAVYTFLASLPAFFLAGAYHRNHGYLTGLARLLGGWMILLAGFTVISFVTKTSERFSREVILVWSVSGYAVLALCYLILQSLYRRHARHLHKQARSLIIGTGDHALNLADKLVRIRREPLQGLVSTDSGEEMDYAGIYPLRGSLAHLRALLAEHDIRRLYIALPLSQAEQVSDLYISLLDASVDIVWVPDFGGLTLLNHSMADLEGLPMIKLNESPLTSYPASAMTKAMLDRTAAGLAILLLSPLLIATAIAVKLSSPGPVLFKQKRHGWNGTVILVWKFRSMRMHDDTQVKQATRSDPRITRVGAFIRRTSIDELPQLFNVLQGSMSLVGPRPHAIEHNDYYTDKINAYMARHRIKPGITGLAQISGSRGETETLEKMQRRVELDLAYINNWSLWLDIKILLKTPLTLFDKNIY